MFKTGFLFRRIAGLVVIAVMGMAGLASAHGRTHVPAVAVTKATAPCHDHAKRAQDACREICASGLADHVLADAAPVIRAPVLVAPVVYEIPRVVFVPSRRLMAAAWWHPPPGEGLPAFLRHQRLLI